MNSTVFRRWIQQYFSTITHTSVYLMIKSFKFRIYPTDSQERKIRNVLQLCQSLYNGALEERRNAWSKEKRSVKYKEQQNCLPDLKTQLPEYKDVYSQILQDTLKRVDKGYQGFFRRIKSGEKPGYPRFKSIFRYNSFTYPQSGFKISKDRIFLSKIGYIKLIQHRPVVRKIKTCSVIRTDSGKYYICVTAETEVPVIEVKDRKEIGIDLGIKAYAVTSEGRAFENPKILKRHEKRLAKAQRKLSNKEKKSPARKRAKHHVIRIHE